MEKRAFKSSGAAVINLDSGNNVCKRQDEGTCNMSDKILRLYGFDMAEEKYIDRRLTCKG